MHRMHGYKGQVKADKTGGATLVAIASLNHWTLDQKRDLVDVTAFQDTNHIYVVGLADMKGTIGGWFDADDDTVFDLAEGTVAANLELTPDSSIVTTPPKWSGKAWVDASIDVKSDGGVSISGNWAAAGPWTRVGLP